MFAFDLFLQRLLTRLRAGLPGPTIASRLKPKPTWKSAPPHQRPSAYVQYVQLQQQLRQLHLQQKFLPKIIDALYAFLTSQHFAELIKFVLCVALLIFLFSLLRASP